jgi:hypothetical protein
MWIFGLKAIFWVLGVCYLIVFARVFDFICVVCGVFGKEKKKKG